MNADTIQSDVVTDAKGAEPRTSPGRGVSSGVMSRSPCDEETLAFLTLAAIRGVGHKTLTEIAEQGHSFAEILATGPGEKLPLARRFSPAGKPSADWTALRTDASERAQRMADLLRDMSVKLIFRSDPRFPAALTDLERPPHWLFVQGSFAALNRSAIAIVGTRRPSDDGLFLARYVGACLQDWGAATVSGLAAGIDQLAHESSLRAEVPTVAVLGTGILDNYPRGSDLMRERILTAGGAIISEYLPRASYSADNFVQRNRLQAALGRVLIPVEWARRSGTAHTVRFASKLGRPVATLRLADWPHDRVVLEPGVGAETGEIFTLPRQHDAFSAFIGASIGSVVAPVAGQLSLFGED